MEKKVASFKEYEIFVADKSCLNEIANFVVRENYSHHISSFTLKFAANPFARTNLIVTRA